MGYNFDHLEFFGDGDEATVILYRLPWGSSYVEIGEELAKMDGSLDDWDDK